MADVKISALPAATSVTGGEAFPMVQDSTTKQVPLSVMLAGVGAPPATPAVPAEFKDSVDTATTANITLSGEQTIDGVLTSASRVLVKNQTLGATNGIYVSAAGAWSRSTDADTSAEVTAGMLVYVNGVGTVNGNLIFTLVTPDPITLGTTVLTFQAIPIASPAIVGKTVAGTTYTTILTDSSKRLNCTNAGTKTITVARQATVAYAVNTEIEVFNAGAGLLTLAPDTGVTLNSYTGLLTVAQFQCVKLKKRANPNTWDVTSVVPTITDLQGTGSSSSAAGFRGIPSNIQSGNYTIILADSGKAIVHPAAGGAGDTYTVDSVANQAWPDGACVTIDNRDLTNSVAVAVTTQTLRLGGTTTTGTRTVAAGGIGTLRFASAEGEWVISGAGVT